MRAPDTLPDALVVAETLADPERFAVLIERYEEKLGRYIWRLGVGRPEDREDILQNVFIAAYKNLRSFDQSLSFSSWIYRIAHNETVSWFRRTAARPEHLSSFQGDDLSALVSDIELPDRAAMTQERAALVRKALSELSPRYRDPLFLRFFEGKSYEEIADILEMPVGTVATLVRRGKDRFKSVLGTYQYEHHG
jgi:RNA polymerase sigma-70 factor, ECF subfamily